MLRPSVKPIENLVHASRRSLRVFSKAFSKLRETAPQVDEAQHSEARSWLATFTPGGIPKRICDVHYSRASGPGGQNVNKVHTKANLRINLEDLLPLLPKLIRADIRSSRYYVNKSDSLMITADSSRTQSTNLQECYKKLYDAITDAAQRKIRGQTAPEKIERVKQIQKRSNGQRLIQKKLHGNKKIARSKSKQDFA